MALLAYPPDTTCPAYQVRTMLEATCEEDSPLKPWPSRNSTRRHAGRLSETCSGRPSSLYTPFHQCHCCTFPCRPASPRSRPRSACPCRKASRPRRRRRTRSEVPRSEPPSLPMARSSSLRPRARPRSRPARHRRPRPPPRPPRRCTRSKAAPRANAPCAPRRCANSDRKCRIRIMSTRRSCAASRVRSSRGMAVRGDSWWRLSVGRRGRDASIRKRCVVVGAGALFLQSACGRLTLVGVLPLAGSRHACVSASRRQDHRARDRRSI